MSQLTFPRKITELVARARPAFQFLTATRRRTAFSGAALLGLIAVPVALFVSSGKSVQDEMLYQVRQGNLVISVLEGGTLFSVGALEIKSQVEGSVSIISVLPEGTVLTPEDVINNRVLMELDSSNLRERELQQDVTVQSAEASWTQAKEQFKIQENQNESDIKAAELAVKFARMDLEKYLGVGLAAMALAKEIDLATLCAETKTTEEISSVLRGLELGGQAKQDWTKLQSDIDLAGEEVKRAQTNYHWSELLGPAGKGYVSQSDVDADALALKRQQASMAQAELAMHIFLKYDLPKQAEKLISDYNEACKGLEREMARARAEMAKVRADLKSKEATYTLQKGRLDKLNDQIDHCTIRATKPGMLVYPATSIYGRGGQDKIEEGALVRERQVLLTIPSSGTLAMNVKVHEASINKVCPGQRARIVLESFPDRELEGIVEKVAVLADPQNPWLSPDLKVYNVVVDLVNPPTDINIKPTMAGRVEIIVDTLRNVLTVPLQSVATVAGKRVCYVQRGGAPEQREIVTGDSNDNFIAVKSGLNDGDRVLLHLPVLAGTAAEAEIRPSDKKDAPPAPNGNGATTTTLAPANGSDKASDAASAQTQGNGADAASPNGKKPEDKAEAKPEQAKLEPRVEAFLNRLPEERRAEVRAKWEAMTPEERDAQLKQMEERRRQRDAAKEGNAQ